MPVVHNRLVFLIFCVTMIALPCSAQEVPHSVEPAAPPISSAVERFVSLRAEGSNGHQLVVSVPTLSSTGVAHATVMFEERVWQVDENRCEAFKAAIFKFREIPPIRIGDAYLQSDQLTVLAMPATRKDGEIWLIKARGYSPDGAVADVEIRGGQGPYAGWVSDVVATIKACGDAVSPNG